MNNYGSVKKVFSLIDFRLNVPEKKLTITYGANKISLWLGEDGKIHFDTNLILDGPAQ